MPHDFYIYLTTQVMPNQGLQYPENEDLTKTETAKDISLCFSFYSELVKPFHWLISLDKHKTNFVHMQRT